MSSSRRNQLNDETVSVSKANLTAKRPKQRKLLSVSNVQNGGIFKGVNQIKYEIDMKARPGQIETISNGPHDAESERHDEWLASTTLSREKVVYDERAEPKRGRVRVTRHQIGVYKPDMERCASAFSILSSSSDGLSDFIVSDSASESELKRPPRSMRKNKCSPLARTPRARRKIVLDDSDEEQASMGDQTTKRLGDVLQELAINSVLKPNQPALKETSSNNEVSSSRTQRSVFPIPLVHTPPTSPSRPRLQSPTKSRTYIPHSPHRQSIDAFWNQGIINEWNDVYSPQKTQKIKKFIDLENDSLSPLKSPQRKLTYSPRKDKSELERKKLFDSRKHSLASDFLTDLDQTITEGKLAALSSSTGGIKIVWSKTLNSTAGRAKWQKEAIRTTEKTSTSSLTKTSYKHSASIELAEKVIDDEDRLLNVLAHEFCHLANFMVSNVKDQPHGKSFKEWAAKVTSRFPHKNIHVTTKHSYAIDYKYVWGCIDCGSEYKRHSRSIDPARHTCGTCKGKLLQIKPVPRVIPSSVDNSEKISKGNPYQAFVKEHYATIKQENPRWKMQEVMSELARKYRVRKSNAESGVISELQAAEDLVNDSPATAILISNDEQDIVDDSLRKLDETMIALRLD